MGFDGVNVNRLNGGLGRNNSTADDVLALLYVVPTAALPAGVTHNTAITLLQLRDAETAGFNASLDANSDLLVYSEVSEFFRLAPDATLHLIPVPDALTPVAILQQAALKTTLRNLPAIKGFGIQGTTETAAQQAALVEGVQSEINAWRTEHRLFDFVILAGKGPAAGNIAVAAYADLRTKNAPQVSVSIAQDPDVASLDAAYAKYASVGSVLGMLAVRQVNENLGSVDILSKPDAKKGQNSYPLTEAKRWAGAALSDGTKAVALSVQDCKALTAKGWIFAASFEDFAGVYLNSSPTCVEAASDYAYIENNRVWNKAARLIRRTLLPEVKGRVKKDPQTGYIRKTTIARWEGLVLTALQQMEAADEISGSSCYINPNQLLSETSPLKVSAKVVVDDIVHQFDVDLGLSRTV